MKIYVKTLILFIITFALGVIVRHFVQPFVSENLLEIIFKAFIAVIFYLFIWKFNKGKWELFASIKWKKHYYYLVLILFILFGINNYFQAIFSDWESNRESLKSSLLGIHILSFFISSTSEEIIYRGFIQSFINSNTKSNSSVISKGNLFASALFFTTHLGFFTVMNPVFAVSSLVNVIIYSLIAGYIFDKTKNIFVLIVLHISINMLHVFIQVNF